MEITGIICEFNPLHNGHKYIIDQARSLFPDNAIALIMSGNIVQRGELASFDKSLRAKWAIKAGADIVFELPSVFSSSYAALFARGSIFMFSQIPQITSIVFGSECGDVELLHDNLETTDKDVELQSRIKKIMEGGSSYPKAISESYGYYYDFDKIENFFTPNNILAMEYLRSIAFFKSKIKPYTVSRQIDGNFLSATQIRRLLNLNREEGYQSVKPFIPDFVFKDLKGHINFEAAHNCLFSLLKHKILSSDDNFSDISEVYEGIENRFIKGIEFANCYEDYIAYVKSKRYTMSKIKRVLLAIMIEKTKTFEDSAFSDLDYIKVLAVRSKSKFLLSTESSLKFITKTSDLETLSEQSHNILKIDKACDDLFNVCNNRKATRIYTHKMEVCD